MPVLSAVAHPKYNSYRYLAKAFQAVQDINARPVMIDRNRNQLPPWLLPPGSPGQFGALSIRIFFAHGVGLLGRPFRPPRPSLGVKLDV
jgi:hypothetical protein